MDDDQLVSVYDMQFGLEVWQVDLSKYCFSLFWPAWAISHLPWPGASLSLVFLFFNLEF